jgi:peptidoglycan/LPS O-acetylase OafA/YrhL
LEHRNDIDGLRAVAVLAVVLFHLGFGLPGGFAGVDVFFVISGYLIASQLYAHADSGAFSIAAFYERRARRILPALLATITASALAAYLVFDPSELVAFAKSGIAAVLFSANIYFYATSDYFSPSADTVPLLHLWSLGIEEQFYILFPLLVGAAARFGRRLLSIGLPALLLASLATSQLAAATNPIAGFYLPDSRAFELLIGTVVALPAIPNPKSALWANLASIAAVCYIGAALVVFGPATPFPGFAALLPCIGTAGLIWSGRGANPIASRLLSFRPLVGIGKISYSLYLVHWPVLVFGKRLFPHADPALLASGVALLSLALAAFSYRFIEQPFRRPGSGRSSLQVLSDAAASITCIVALCAWTVHLAGFEPAGDQRIGNMLAYLHFDPRPLYRSRECFLDPDQDLTSIDIKHCLPSENGAPAMLWGDSRAAALFPGLKTSLAKEGYSLGELTASACSPVVGLDRAERPKCRAFNDAVLSVLLSMRPKIVILAAYWLPDGHSVTLLNETIARLAGRDIKVVMLGNSPLFNISVPAIVVQRIQSKRPGFASHNDLELEYQRSTESLMSSAFGHRSDVRYVSIFDTVCPDERCPLLANDETPIYFDSAHLTEAGSLLFATMLTPQILR